MSSLPQYCTYTLYTTRKYFKILLSKTYIFKLKHKQTTHWQVRWKDAGHTSQQIKSPPSPQASQESWLWPRPGRRKYGCAARPSLPGPAEPLFCCLFGSRLPGGAVRARICWKIKNQMNISCKFQYCFTIEIQSPCVYIKIAHINQISLPEHSYS